MKIAVVGTGYVGLVAGTCFADMGHEVICVDIEEEKIRMLNEGKVPIFEPGLEDLIKKNARAKRLSFTTDFDDAVKKSDIIFIAVGTPPKPNGDADLSYIENVARGIAAAAKKPKIVVEKSTVPVQTCERIIQVLDCNDGDGNGRCVKHIVVSNPEFLREGSAVKDFLFPDRIVIGTEDEHARKAMEELYAPLKAKILFTDIKSAEIIKHASNSFLAAKISFINAVASICEKTGADIGRVAEGMGLDKRIGASFLNAGIGYGGFCFSGKELVFAGNPSVQPTAFEDAFNGFDSKKDFRCLVFKNGAVVEAPLVGFSKRHFKGEMLSISTAMGRSIEVTAEHPLPVVKGGKMFVKEAKSVEIGDELPFIASLPEKPVERIDLIDAISGHPGFFSSIKLRPKSKKLIDLKGRIAPFLKVSPMVKHDYFRKNYLRLKDFLQLEAAGAMPLPREEFMLFTAKGNTTYFPAILKLDESFWRFVGYYLAEGDIFYEKCERGTRSRIKITFNSKEREYIEDVSGILSSLGIKFLLGNYGKTARFTVSSKVFCFLLDSVLKCGRTSYDANVPSMAFLQSKENKKSLLQGLFRGDAYPYFHKHAEAITIEYGTVSEKLANSVIVLLQSLGVVASRKTQLMKKSTVPAHIVRVSCNSQVRKLCFFDSGTNKKIIAKLSKSRKKIRPIGFREYKGFFGLKVKKIEKRLVEKDVYSLQLLKEPHLFVSSYGLIAHNCFPKDVEAFIRISEKNGYDFKLLKEVQAVNNFQKQNFVKRVEDALWNLNGKTIGVLGLAFKPNTDDMRFAPSIDIINALLKEGAKVKAFDPEAMERAKAILGGKIEYCEDMYAVAQGADALLFLTEWDCFKKIDLAKAKKLLKQPFLFDGRNMFDPKEMRSLGFKYESIGRL